MYEFEKVIEGLTHYIDSELCPRMNDVQNFAIRVLAGRVIENENNIKEALIKNGFFRTFGIMDSDGMVDVEGLSNDIKREIARRDKLTLSIPWIGKLTFRPSDVDVLHRMIAGEEIHNDNN